MSTARNDLSIDASQAITRIAAYLGEVVASHRADGLLLGLSGGLDSSVMAALSARAVTADRLHVAYLYDRDSERVGADHAQQIADNLGIRLEMSDISDEMDKLGIYRPLFVQSLRISPIVARVSVGTYRLLCRETPFKSTLRDGGGERLRPWYKRLLFDHTMRHVDAGFRARHIFRRKKLEVVAAERNLVLIGAANRSESQVGWFVKDGIDDLPIQPMIELLKTQVRQLAKALELPTVVRKQRPSPDMARGLTDEFGIGHSYALVDIAIDALDQRMTKEEIVALGVPLDELNDICDLITLSAWKRTSPSEKPPVSGAFGSPLRLSRSSQ